ncbi:MAG: hypothetical protein IPJ07_23420 [Acidobacteria bacterium]|nr:hypothetical protein [Acidobacteriota bacterium]
MAIKNVTINEQVFRALSGAPVFPESSSSKHVAQAGAVLLFREVPDRTASFSISRELRKRDSRKPVVRRPSSHRDNRHQIQDRFAKLRAEAFVDGRRLVAEAVISSTLAPKPQ